MTSSSGRVEGSFRDPSGFLFRRDGVLYRQVNLIYREHFQRLIDSGLYTELSESKLLIPHSEVDVEPDDPSISYRVIRPDEVAFISYPYEWCFSQLKDAALLTLDVQQRALTAGMTLKDSSAYNVQFHNGRPVLIDTLSFETYQEGRPWTAYRQFCQHFLGPLALMSLRDIRLARMMQSYIDGIPLDMVSELLPWRTRLNFGLLSHIHLHAAAQQRYSERSSAKPGSGSSMSRRNFQALLENLGKTISSLQWKSTGTEWGDYYESSSDHYAGGALDFKERIVREFIQEASPRGVWDLGANIGRFSRCASDQGIFTVAFDIDPAAVERNYLACRERGESFQLPLITDLTNPSSAIGWGNRERQSLIERAPADLVLALALIHHLAISNNVPLIMIAGFLSELCGWLIIEFVPKTDPQVQRLLASREDIFVDYHEQAFESAFGNKFAIVHKKPIPETQRILYLMMRR